MTRTTTTPAATMGAIDPSSPAPPPLEAPSLTADEGDAVGGDATVGVVGCAAAVGAVRTVPVGDEKLSIADVGPCVGTVEATKDPVGATVSPIFVGLMAGPGVVVGDRVVGTLVGKRVGTNDGARDSPVRADVGTHVDGTAVGALVGIAVGDAVGAVGEEVGAAVGESVATHVCALQAEHPVNLWNPGKHSQV